MRDQFIRAGGIRTRYRIMGRGDVPLVMLHGLAGQLADWGGAAQALSRDRGMETVRLAGRRAVLAVDGAARRAFVRQLRSFMGPEGFKAAPRVALLEKLPQIDLPTLAIWGRGDMFVPARHTEVLTRLMPDCDLVLLEQCGHMPQLERPAACVRAISDFLK